MQPGFGTGREVPEDHTLENTQLKLSPQSVASPASLPKD